MSSREPSGEPASRPSEPADAPASVSGRGAAPGPAARRGPRARTLAALVALTLSLGAVAGVAAQRYIAVHLRAPPKVPACVRGARVTLRKPVTASGSEPRQTVSGETVYLTPGEDLAVACAFQVDERLARHLAGALAEHEPARRAARLLEIVRDHIPADPAHDRTAAAAYMMAAAAMRPLPVEVPGVSAAAEELEQRHACRFGTRRVCPTRPPPPPIVWIAGVPAALSALSLVWIGLAAGAARYGRWRASRRRRSRGALEDRGARAARLS
ncbi:hypothetical protein SOCE26_007490 [Sorangium cellulosum]|uniref:Uncharacterized protein n=1 Tax=Sorangium cellulosum TaxID=56 RepID=A0A2L0EJ81_SORCE|nr:hypothetical protein [Sorangium cellulosum]AUX39360.1 hypothetical protein SOCE26_007490 [Sorangium cellulosum]